MFPDCTSIQTQQTIPCPINRRSGTVNHEMFKSAATKSLTCQEALVFCSSWPLSLNCFFLMVFICSVVSKIYVFSLWCLHFSCALQVREDILPSILLVSLWKSWYKILVPECSFSVRDFFFFFLSRKKCSTGLIISMQLTCLVILSSWFDYWRYLRILPSFTLYLEVLVCSAASIWWCSLIANLSSFL